MKEIKKTDNNTMELNISEMEQVYGGCKYNKSQRVHRDPSTGSASKSSVNDAEILVRTITVGKAACDWITGLLD